jgi:hypothetical protein
MALKSARVAGGGFFSIMFISNLFALFE